MSKNEDEALVGDMNDVAIRSGDDHEQYDFYLVGPDRGSFGFDTAEVQDIRSMLERTLGDG